VALRYQPEGRGFDSRYVIDIILPAALWLCGRLSLDRNEYQGYLLGDKGGRCHLAIFMCRLSRNPESLSLLEP
jgi:hypothetical protein